MSRHKHPIAVAGNTWNLQAFPAGKSFFELTKDERPVLRWGRSSCGKFSETSALPEIFRSHCANDGQTVTIDSSGVIPFGGEFRIDREITVGNGAALLRTSVAGLTGGKVGNFSLEDVTFSAPWSKVEILVYGEKKFRSFNFAETGELYRGQEVPWVIRVTFADGLCAEVISGGDLWRHRASFHTEGVTGEFALTCEADGLHFTREILRYAEETPVEKRPWQFETLIGWTVPAAESRESWECIPCSGCLCARSVQRNLRELVRGAKNDLRLAGYKSTVCLDSAHLERPGHREMEHCDAADLLQLYWWANRQMQRKNLAFSVENGGGILQNSILLAALAGAPGSVEIQDQEENKK